MVVITLGLIASLVLVWSGRNGIETRFWNAGWRAGSSGNVEVDGRQRPVEWPALTAKGPWLFGLIADLDDESTRTASDGTTHWVSYFKRGQLRAVRGGSLTVEWIDEVELSSSRSKGGRGMELSELVWYQGKLLAPDDRTSIMFEIQNPLAGLPAKYINGYPAQDSPVQASIGAELNLDVHENVKSSFKAEWCVVKDGNLIVGGHGREQTSPTNGTLITSTLPMHIGQFSPMWKLDTIDWTKNYNKLRNFANVPFPGYLLHETALWSTTRREWIFLPRRVSTRAYDRVDIENKGARDVYIATEDFSRIRHVVVEGLAIANGERGFSSAAFVPGTGERVILATRTVEHDATDMNPRRTQTYLCAFDITRPRDKELVLPELLVSEKKFEGVSIL